MRRRLHQTPADYTFTRAFVAALAFAPAIAGAVALGEPATVSGIGEPLRIEIGLAGGDAARATECLRIVAERDHNDLPRVREGRISTTGQGSRARIVISNPAPAYEPILRLGIEDICDSRLRRDYTLLLSFPDPARALATPTGASIPSPADAREPEPQPAPSRRARPAREGDKTGASRPAVPPADAAGPDTRKSTPAAKQDRLVLGGGESETPGAGLRMSTELASIGRIDATSDVRRDELRREQSVIMAIDRTIVAQLELTERIHQLEEVQRRMMEQLHANSTPQAAAVKTASVTPQPERDTTASWLYPAAALGGLSLALAAALSWMRQRRADATRGQDYDLPAEPTVAPWNPPSRPAPAAPPAADLAAPPFTQPGAPFPHPAERAPLGWDTVDDAIAPIVPIAPIAPIEEPAEEHESAIELAEIMMGFGRLQGAADTLAEFIASNPKRAVTPWLKLLEVYRAANLREEFDTLAMQLNKTFNVKSVTWESFEEARQSKLSIEQMAHVSKKIQDRWGTTEGQAYLEKLLRDNRDGTREGFPLSVIDEILTLATVLEDQLGPYRPPAESPDTPPEPIAPDLF